ncbi:hypothetical protein Hte_011813 [Hypoxylon texense]
MSWSGLCETGEEAPNKRQRLHSPDDDRDNNNSTTRFRLNWGSVTTLDQDPEGKEHFPPHYNTFGMGYFFLGDEVEKPAVAEASDLPRFTAWAFAAFKRGTLSATMAKMRDDQNLRVKWVICPSKDFNGKFRDLNLSPATAPRVNHEGRKLPTRQCVLYYLDISMVLVLAVITIPAVAVAHTKSA